MSVLIRYYGIRITCATAIVLSAGNLNAQTDPGPRGGAPGAGGVIAGLTAGEQYFFTNQAVPQFTQVEKVADGLGPRFNLDSCSGCHIHPAVGGSSPPHSNPQVVRAPLMAPGNTIPSFLTVNGPIREVRFKRSPDGLADGGVHDIFTIGGRSDKPTGCTIQQPNFSETDNLSFRIPTPVFGAGLIEAIPDTTIRNNLASDPGGKKRSLGIKGEVGTNGNDGTVTRFGWKAQNKSLLIFAGEAYNVEMGVTNETFPNEREEGPCATATPNNASGYQLGSTDPADIVSFMGLMKFLDQPAPACTGTACSPSIQNGRTLFSSVGCALCHTPSLTTGNSSTIALANKQANLFSDLAIHHMGSGLSDGVTQGAAGPDEFRTSPLWGVGQRAFFLHDGRTSDLVQAIQGHSKNCNFFDWFNGCSESEANEVIAAFNALTTSQKQDLINFLRSL